MYMRKINKLNESEIQFFKGANIYKLNDFPPNCNFMNKDDFDSEVDMYSDLLPYVTEIPVIDAFFDEKRCWKEHDVAEHDVVIGYFQNSTTIEYSFDSGKRISLSMDEYDQYVYEKEASIYVWKDEEVDYWRKYYELNDFIAETRMTCKCEEFENEHDREPTEKEKQFFAIENCGYYELSKEEKEQIRNFLIRNGSDDAKKDYWNEEDAHIFYHAWW